MAEEGTFTWDDVQQAIAEALDKQNQQHQEALDSVRASVGGVVPATGVPTHAGGPGTVIRDTWSFAEQTAARLAEEAAKAAVTAVL